MLLLEPQTVLKLSLNTAYVKLGASQAEIDIFKIHLTDFFARFNESESEEFLKNLIADLLKNTYYKGKFEINTKDRKDLVIHNGKTAKDSVGVIIETKIVKSNERITLENCNTKSLHELILYYFDERENKKNIEIKFLVATNGFEWFLFDENSFDKIFYRNREFITLFKTKIEQKKDNPFFYSQAAKIIENMEEVLPCTFFDIRDFSPSLLERAGVGFNEEIPISPSLLDRAGVGFNEEIPISPSPLEHSRQSLFNTNP